MKRPVKSPRDRRPAGRATRPCPERARDPKFAPPPPKCCPTPSDSPKRDLIERRARIEIDLATARIDPRAADRARAERQDDLLAADIALAERREQTLECGIECLEEDIEAARARVARKPPSLWNAVSQRSTPKRSSR